jgi:hypothetical protein
LQFATPTDLPGMLEQRVRALDEERSRAKVPQSGKNGLFGSKPVLTKENMRAARIAALDKKNKSI